MIYFCERKLQNYTTEGSRTLYQMISKKPNTVGGTTFRGDPQPRPCPNLLVAGGWPVIKYSEVKI